MSVKHAEEIMSRAVAEPAYRALLFRDPDTALAGYPLTEAQTTFFRQLSPERFYDFVGTLVLHRIMPVRASRRFVLVPSDRDLSVAPDCLPLRLGPGWAFGNGTHPSTQLCLELLDNYLHVGQRVLDLGTGSGILAIGAAKLGAAAVLALDIADDAVQQARENVALNGVQQIVRVEHGSLDTALQAIASGQAGASDLVVANILAPIIVTLLEAGLAQALRPTGTLILSGFVEKQVAGVCEALLAAGLAVIEQRESQGWFALAARDQRTHCTAVAAGAKGIGIITSSQLV